MPKMLGRYETPGCCKGARIGWTRRKGFIGPDCSGPGTDTRWRKRVEQISWRREAGVELYGTEITVATDVLRDCAHGCDGECLLYPGPHECGFTCHPGRLYESGGVDDLARELDDWVPSIRNVNDVML